MTIKVPKKHCSTAKSKCKFFCWTGNTQEDFCGLYQKFTCNDAQYPEQEKPVFCKAIKVQIVEES
ncbi:hypothetical protein UFOVP558_38 [uncultured Caudovirales phage]|uniref:Uncharacterized protein n=1 Tax=uncultured Caudovirales phage TaxID=2100421 RepID=A0A6J5MXZ7_9CAUD|nr:hypothetical protein UFOVP558_38 [uncultured Caudovirales phage]